MATHSTLLTWRIPWTEEPGGLHGFAKESEMTEHAACWSGKAMRSFFFFTFSLLLKDKLSRIKSFKSLFKQKSIQTRQHPGQLIEGRSEEPTV